MTAQKYGDTPAEILLTLTRRHLCHKVGRRQRYRWGPREVDLRIVFYDSLVYEAEDRSLEIPHARVHERDFVLAPLCDIAPELVHPSLQVPCGLGFR